MEGRSQGPVYTASCDEWGSCVSKPPQRCQDPLGGRFIYPCLRGDRVRIVGLRPRWTRAKSRDPTRLRVAKVFRRSAPVPWRRRMGAPPPVQRLPSVLDGYAHGLLDAQSGEQAGYPVGLLSLLSDAALLASTRELVKRSNELLADLVLHLAEVDERQLFRARAFPSMFVYCVGSSASPRRVSGVSPRFVSDCGPLSRRRATHRRGPPRRARGAGASHHPAASGSRSASGEAEAGASRARPVAW